MLYSLLEKIRSVCEKENIEITVFEATTIVAFMAFSENEADVNVIEVGMGGRLDATNVFEDNQVLVSVFTSIDVDHIKFLGDTALKNALEKSDIIKNNGVVISGPQKEDVAELLKLICEDRNCATGFFGEDFNIEILNDKKFSYLFQNQKMTLDLPYLLGNHQVVNAATAIMSILAGEKFAIDINHINAALKNTYLPARMQKVTNIKLINMFNKNCEIYMDGAHNTLGAMIVADFIRQKNDNKRNYLIIGRTADTDSTDFLKSFENLVTAFMTVRVTGEPLSDAPENIVKSGKSIGIENIFNSNNLLQALEDIKKFDDSLMHSHSNLVNLAVNNSESIRIIICGSFYLARDLKSLEENL